MDYVENEEEEDDGPWGAPTRKVDAHWGRKLAVCSSGFSRSGARQLKGWTTDEEPQRKREEQRLSQSGAAARALKDASRSLSQAVVHRKLVTINLEP